jgi:hypothetical protein
MEMHMLPFKKALVAAQCDTVDAVIALLQDKLSIELDEEQMAVVNSFKLGLKAYAVPVKETKKSKKAKEEAAGEVKEKRPPSKYNLFIKEKMPILKKENPELNHREIMSMAGALWTQHKNNPDENVVEEGVSEGEPEVETESEPPVVEEEEKKEEEKKEEEKKEEKEKKPKRERKGNKKKEVISDDDDE